MHNSLHLYKGLMLTCLRLYCTTSKAMQISSKYNQRSHLNMLFFWCYKFRTAFKNRATSCFIWGFLEYMCSSLQKPWALMFPLQNNSCNIYFFAMNNFRMFGNLNDNKKHLSLEVFSASSVLPSYFIIQICITTKWICSTVKY